MVGLLDTGRGNYVCNSVQDMQTRLQNLLASKSSDTRAEHASFTFELRYNTVFHLSADVDGSPDGAIDPVRPIARSVNASETIQNQPSDDPVLQRAVAKHIVSAMGIIDSSSWVVRQVSRDARGWTFTYICKDSLQAWTRANAKSAEKPAIGSYSGSGGLDPINLSRPAFDCRGTLTIAFSTSARGVVVKYNHTPIHKTVAQLVQLLAPALPPAPVQNGNAGSQRTLKTKRPPPAEGEEGSRRKRQRKGKAPEAPMGMPEEGESSLGNGQGGQDNVAPQNAVPDGLHLTSILNVPPEEAERRRQKAIDLLHGKNVNPATLTAEQFNILANQAPDLQAASLEMLAMYGAEKLRIVHPDEKNQASEANSTPAENQSDSATPITEPANTSTLDTTETPTRKRRSRKKKSDGPVNEVSIGDGAVISVEQSGEVGTTTSALQPTAKKTRGACETCKGHKVKCTKEHPRCSNCVTAGVECIYLPPRPRRKRSGINGEAEEQEASDLPEGTEENQAQAQTRAPAQISTTPVTVQHSARRASPSPLDPENEEFIPDPNILSGPVEQQPRVAQPLAQPPTQYFHKLKFPKDSSSSPAKQMATPALTFLEPQTQHNRTESSPGLTYPSASHPSSQSAEVDFPQQASVMNQKRQSISASSRRSFPSGQDKQTPVPAPTVPQNTSGWNVSPTPGHATTTSPTLSKKQTPKRSKARKSGTEPSQQAHVEGQEQDGMKQAAALSQAAIQRQSQASRAVESPYQNVARLKSRQGNRSQTSTPVAPTTRPPPQAPQAASNTPYNTTSSASIPNYDPYARYDNSTSGQYANTTSDQGSSRIAYEPGSYQPTTGATTTSTSYSSAPAYDYSQSNRSSNPLSHALNSSTGYANPPSSTTAQWPPSRPQSTQPHTQSHTTNAYSVPPATSTVSHSYGTRSAGSRAQHQNASYNQHQPQQSYGSYPAQQSNTNQQPPQNWYSNTNQNSYNGNQNSGYSNATNPSRTASYNSQRSNVPYNPGQGYSAGSDDQSLYDLLRASGSTH
ncbi:hypothetical protein F4818DRAFT_93299 [Hypoxylon cercidicola]|nr:hypothetical protein F4818DRAFT_93299 [Hypoxylon cercidicola]